MKNPEDVMVTSKLADFMWHSHMQDPEGYRKDMMKLMGRVLNHRDDYSKDQLQKYDENMK